MAKLREESLRKDLHKSKREIKNAHYCRVVATGKPIDTKDIVVMGMQGGDEVDWSQIVSKVKRSRALQIGFIYAPSALQRSKDDDDDDDGDGNGNDHA